MILRWMVCCVSAILLMSAASSRAADSSGESTEKGSHILLVWPDDSVGPDISKEELAGFLGTLRKGDRLAVYLPGRDALVLRFDTSPQGRSAEVAGLVFEGIRVLKETRPISGTVTPGEALVRAATRFKNTKTERVRAIVLLPSAEKLNNRVVSDTDSGSSKVPADFETNLVVNGLLLFPVLSENMELAEISALADKVGGRTVVISARTRIKDALVSVYETIQLRSLELANEQPLYESDSVCPPAVPDVALTEEVLRRIDRTAGLLWIVLACSAISLLAFAALLILVKSRRLSMRVKYGPLSTATRKREAPAFSKISIGVGRIRNAFSQAETQLTALSADIEDFGSENWDTQKNMLSAYSGIADQLFLMLDHIELKPRGQGSELDEFLSRRLEQILEDCEIEGIVPEPGVRFHSKFHTHAGERESDEDTGTILEVVRKGYQRRRGFGSDEPYVIRPAEVIVSIGRQKQREAP